MGGARTGGSDTADDKKQDSYAKQFRKNYTVNKKTGKVKKRNVISRLIINSPTGTVVGDFADNHNYKRRLKFAEKNNLNLISKSKEYLISPAGKAYLDEFGYADTLKAPTGNNDDDRGNNNNTNTQTQMASGVVTNTGTVPAPTNAEVTQASATTMSADEILIANKKKGRKQTILKTASGLGDSTLQTTKKTLGA
mgnify:CR=1 FL=1